MPPRPQPRNLQAMPQPTVNSSEAEVMFTFPTATSNDVAKDDTPPPSSQQAPVKPARHKNKQKGPPKPPSPYGAGRKKVSLKKVGIKIIGLTLYVCVCIQTPPTESQFDNNDGDADVVDSKADDYRRHTISSKPKPKDPPSRKTSDFSREKFSPPEVMLDSLYATVDKSKRYPAPSVPAPPPPYEGNTLKKIEENSVPPERAVSPPGYELVANAPESSAKKPASGAPPPARPPPSRPSRPPAGSYM